MKDPLAEELKEKFNEWEYNDDGSRHWYTDWQALAEYVRMREIEVLEKSKYRPSFKQIPCPDGNRGCLVIHYSGDLTLDFIEKAHNDRIDRIIAVLKSQLEGQNERR